MLRLLPNIGSSSPLAARSYPEVGQVRTSSFWAVRVLHKVPMVCVCVAVHVVLQHAQQRPCPWQKQYSIHTWFVSTLSEAAAIHCSPWSSKLLVFSFQDLN